MKHSIKTALLGGALASASAFGQTLDANDYIVYIEDTANSTFYAEDTGASLSSVVGSTGSAVGQLTAAQLNAGRNLSAFLDQAGGTFIWAVAAAGTATNNPGDQIVVGLSSGAPNFTKYGTVDTGINNADNFAQVVQGDLQNSGVQTSATDGWTNATITASQWKEGFGGSTAVISTAALNGSLTLYALTSGTPSSATNTGEVITLTSTGFSVTGGVTTPLPAAAWLLGSGLLGLIGVGRRRQAA
jgi:hypothetical protein